MERSGIKNQIMLGENFGKNKVSTYKENRVCRYPKCKTILSIYNYNHVCDLHRRRLWKDNMKIVKRKGRWRLIRD